MNNVYRKDDDSNIILGKALPAFINNISFHQTWIKVYEDGMIDCWGLVDLKEFKRKVKVGWVVTRVPKDEDISCHHLYYGRNNLEFYVEENEFVKEVEDTLLELQNKKTSSEVCYEQFLTYLSNPSIKNKRELKIAYNNVPKHLRVYVLSDMDLKDYPIKSILKSIRQNKEKFEYWKKNFLKIPNEV